MTQELKVSLGLVANKPKSELNDGLADTCFKLLAPAIEAISGKEALETLRLPPGMPVHVSVSLIPTPVVSGDATSIPLRIAITSAPSFLKQTESLLERISDMVFSTLHQIEVPSDLAKALGYKEDGSALSGTVNLHIVPSTPIQAFTPSVSDLITTVEPWGQGGWGKGCNSWPW